MNHYAHISLLHIYKYNLTSIRVCIHTYIHTYIHIYICTHDVYIIYISNITQQQRSSPAPLQPCADHPPTPLGPRPWNISKGSQRGWFQGVAMGLSWTQMDYLYIWYMMGIYIYTHMYININMGIIIQYHYGHYMGLSYTHIYIYIISSEYMGL